MAFRNLASTFTLGSLLTLAACTSSGNATIKNETAASVDQKIQDGITTKDQIRQLFGDPAHTAFTDSGHEEWQYVFKHEKENATNFIPIYADFHQETHGQSKRLTIIFNGSVVWHHSMTTSIINSNSGVF